jgi:hypothetical protein
MRIIILILLSTASLFAQEGFKVTRLTGTVTYEQAYLNCSASELQLLVQDNSRNLPSIRAKEFLEKYPILDDLKKFKRRKKYSLINVNLLSKEPEFTEKNTIIFTFKNGKKYEIPIAKRIKEVYTI